MKTKIISLTLTVLLTFCLCGCEKYSDYIEPENRLFVSALGVYCNNGKVTTFAEATQTNDTQDGYLISIHKGVGNSFSESIVNITSGVSKQFNLSHCAVVLAGENTDKKTLCEIYEYFKNDVSTNISVYFAACKDPKPFFNEEAPFGYTAAALIKKNLNNSQSKIRCSLTDIKNSEDIFGIPFFKKEENKINLIGMRFYKNNEEILFLDNTKSRIYALITGSFTRGSFTLKSGVLNVVNSRRTLSEDNLNISITASKCNDCDKAQYELTDETNDILSLFYDRYGADILRLGSKDKSFPKVICSVRNGVK